MLEKLVPQNFTYPQRGGILRGLRTLAAIFVAGLGVMVADGSITSELNFLPKDVAPLIILFLPPLITGFDKYFREKDIEKEIENTPRHPNESEFDVPDEAVVQTEEPIDTGSDVVFSESK